VSLTAADVAEIMRLVEQSRFDELDLETGGIKVTLRRAGTSGGMVRSAMMQSGLADAAVAPIGAPVVASGPVDANLTDITSPMLGTFYRAPKPGSAPFVEIGSVVNEDSVIAIIEVMKLMNTVRAGVSGTITDILSADETLVEFGEVLMRVRKDA
jgi:acetyl-CoA carboxylase biotin carboxyl carrier protein